MGGGEPCFRATRPLRCGYKDASRFWGRRPGNRDDLSTVADRHPLRVIRRPRARWKGNGVTYTTVPTETCVLDLPGPRSE